MGQLRDHYPELRDSGVEVLAVSHESREWNANVVEIGHLPFPMLSDKEKRVIRDYMIKDWLPPFIARISYFLVDTHGIIRWKSSRHSRMNPKDLPPFEDILHAVQSLR